MSLAILPSAPITHSQASVPMLIAPVPGPSKRPKLCLNTSQTPILLGGKGSNSLRLETLSAVSPTVRNTFSNGYNPAHALKLAGSKAQRPLLTPLATSSPHGMFNPSTPLEEDVPSLTNSATSSSAVSTISNSTVDSHSTDAPYQLAYNITSILSNGPLPEDGSKQTSFAQTRSIFPAAKKVSFRAPLTETIWNMKFTMAHSDIETSSTITTLETPAPKLAISLKVFEQVDVDDNEVSTRECPTLPSSQTGEKRESSDEEDSDTCPATPVAGRRKRHRQWRWTLGNAESAGKDVGSEHTLPDRSFAGDCDYPMLHDCTLSTRSNGR
ncbi:hypothetical protein LTR08_001810 [Meristemomyces frigidus]|nr:hypothetical protein LTR08_001810 [Meristemomyces frigidus]